MVLAQNSYLEMIKGGPLATHGRKIPEVIFVEYSPRTDVTW